MTQYTQNDPQSDWEFKIVRSDSSAFRNPETLKQLVEEESQAGWVMLEKFDDNRVRFKRPRSARAKDAFLPEDVDPYRTRYGGQAARRTVLVMLMLGALLLSGVVSFFLVQGADSADGPVVTTQIPIILITVLGLAMLFVVKMRRLK